MQNSEGKPLKTFDQNCRFAAVPKKSRVDEICNRLREELLESGATLSDMLAELRSRRESEEPIG